MENEKNANICIIKYIFFDEKFSVRVKIVFVLHTRI